MPRTFVDIEMIRDGGSLKLRFSHYGEKTITLYVPVEVRHFVSGDDATPLVETNYKEPMLIDPEKPNRTAHNPNFGYPMTWEEAESLMNELGEAPTWLNPPQTHWFKQLKAVIAMRGQTKAVSEAFRIGSK